MDDATISLDGHAPIPVHAPTTAAEVGALVRAHAKVVPVGGRTGSHLGPPRSPRDIAIDTRGLNRLVDYPHRDMTVTAEAGMTVAALQAILAREGQTLPVDIPFPDRATLGGAIAVNAAGPRRLGFGTLRDWLIGISFVADNGDEVKAGGRVVKNVAGYDLMKLHLGAFGRFGIVTQVTFKVKPNPESFATVKFDATAAELPALLDRLHESQARPVAVDVMRADDRFTVVCAFEEKAVTVDWQIRTLGDDVKRDVSVDRGDSARATVQRHAEWPCEPVARHVAVPPSAVARTLTTTTSPALAHAMDGIVWIRDGAKADVANRSDAALRETIRRTLDPNGRFS